jgi:plastocyanin
MQSLLLLSHSLLRRVPLTMLAFVVILTLVIAAAAFGSLMLLAGLLIWPLLILSLVSLLLAGLVATGIRWVPLLAALFGLGLIPGGFLTQEYFRYHLTHPQEPGPFAASLLILLCALLLMITGSVVTFRNYRGAARQAPPWLGPFLSGLAGFFLGALCVSMLLTVISAPSAAATGNSGSTPVVHMGISSFQQASVTIPKGSRLLLIDDGQFLHILRNGFWQGGSPHDLQEPGAPALHDLQINGGSISIGPFTTAGTYHIYCTIHPGMNLTIIVTN